MDDDVERIAREIFEASPVVIHADTGEIRPVDCDSLVRDKPEQIEEYRKKARHQLAGKRQTVLGELAT